MSESSQHSIINGLTISISILALIMSGITFYYQFFHVKHAVSYTATRIETNEEKEIIVPLLFRNTGNQEEVLLNVTLHLEIRTDSTSKFKRISEYKKDGFPLMLIPNENKLFNLKGNYKDFFVGKMVVENDEIVGFIPVKYYDELKLLLEVEYIAANGGYAKEDRVLAYIYFNKDKTIEQITGLPVELSKLNMNPDSYYQEYYVLPNRTSSKAFSINLRDSNSIKENQGMLNFIRELAGDSILPQNWDKTE